MSWFLLVVATQAGGPGAGPSVGIVLSVAGETKAWRLGTLALAATTNGRDSLNCEIVSTDSTYRPVMDAEVILTDGTTRIFGGFLNSVRERGIVSGKTTGISTGISALDYNQLAEERHVHESFAAGGNFLTVLPAILPYLDGTSLHPDQAAGPTLEALNYVYVNTATVFEELSTLTGWVWGIDDDRRLRFVEPGTLAAPFNIAANDGHVLGDLTVEPTRSEYCNRVYALTSTITSQRDDTGAQTSYGRVVEKVIFAPDDTTQAALDALAEGLLARSTPTLKRVQYRTLESGLLPGQTQTINLPARNVNNTFLITDVMTYDITADRLERLVTAIEGLVYQTGWRETYRRWSGDGSLSAAGLGGGGGSSVTFQRFAYPLGGTVGEWVSSPTPDWVPASDYQVQINTVARGTSSASVFTQLRVKSGTVTARLRNISDGITVGTSAASSSTVLEWVTFSCTLTAGSKLYRLELLPSVIDESVQAVGSYVE